MLMPNLSSLSLSTSSWSPKILGQCVFAMRPYTRGAEKLFHKVDWDRAIGLVVVVDPFDPGSLLYLPAAAYTDLIKTALANRSPLVVVHGLNDVVPVVTVHTDNQSKPAVEYRIFTVSGTEVHRVPISTKNSPLSPFLSPLTTLRLPEDQIRRSDESLHTSRRATSSSGSGLIAPEGTVPSGQPVSPSISTTTSESGNLLDEINSSGKRTDWDALYKRMILDLKLAQWSGVEDSCSLGLTTIAPTSPLPPPSGKPEAPRATVEELESKGFTAPKAEKWSGHDYSRILEEIRSNFGVEVYRTLRSVSATLSRLKIAPRPSDWRVFLPKDLPSPVAPLAWPGEPASPWRRPLVGTGKVEATLMHLFAWAGATLLARSARSLQWAFAILGKFLKLWQSNGLKTACAVFSESKRVLMKFISDEPVKTAAQCGVPLGISRGLPTVLPRGLRKYIAGGHVTAIRLAFFMLAVSDLLKYEAPAKLTTITAPYDGSAIWDDAWDKEIKQAAKSLVSRAGGAPRLPVWKGFHATVKAGPFAKALLSSPLDSVALYVSPLWESFLQLGKHIRGSDTLVKYTRLLAFVTLTFMKPFWNGLLGFLPVGKLSQVIEPRGKIRTVAIPGYQVQSMFKPVHDSLFDFLSRISEDYTHDQEGGIKAAMTSGALVMRSYDLSAATDRFPRWFEQAAIRHLYEGTVRDASDFAQAWNDVLENLTFSFRKTRSARLEIVKYGSGQPMGTYSSWASFAVSHHLVVSLAALRAGWEGDYLDYALLGDDIVMWGDTDIHMSVFTHYTSIMESLGVGINPLKGISSQNGTFEFAKRFVRGRDVLSSLRWRELSSTRGWKDIFTLLLGMERKGLPLPHLRVALEVGYQLVFQVPFRIDLTDVRRVALARLRAFRVPLVLLTSPVGPYKVPLVAWLSGRGTNLVDFHPNLGHFVNSITRVVMAHEVQYPIAVGMKSVRNGLLQRVLEAQPCSLGILRALIKTMYMVSTKVPSELVHSRSLWKYLDGKHMSDRLRDIVFSTVSSLGDLFTRLGADYVLTTTKEGSKIPEFRYRIPQVLSTCERPSLDLLIGCLRTIVTLCPARLVNRRVLEELLGPQAMKGQEALDPDYRWPFGAGVGRGGDWVAPIETSVEKAVAEVVPNKFEHPSVLLQKCRESITEFMKFSVADVLPSALPAHLDLVDTIAEAQATAVMNSWRALRADPSFTTLTIFTLPESTDRSRAPAYLLEYTNSVRLDTKDPTLIPRSATAVEIPRQLADFECNPLVYKPREGYEWAFASQFVHRGPIRLLNTALPGDPGFFRSLLTESGLQLNDVAATDLGVV